MKTKMNPSKLHVVLQDFYNEMPRVINAVKYDSIQGFDDISKETKKLLKDINAKLVKGVNATTKEAKKVRAAAAKKSKKTKKMVEDEDQAVCTSCEVEEYTVKQTPVTPQQQYRGGNYGGGNVGTKSQGGY